MYVRMSLLSRDDDDTCGYDVEELDGDEGAHANHDTLQFEPCSVVSASS